METKLTPWKVSIDNPDATHDDYVEWFSVSNGTEIYECYSRESANRLSNTLNEHSQLLQQRDELMEGCEEAIKQIEYLHGKFKETGTGNAVIAYLESLIQKHQI